MLASRVPARASVLQLPPTLRVAAYQKTAARSFSASALIDAGLVEAVTAPSALLLDSLHAVGLPWYATIPIAATIVRGLIGYYVGGIPAQRRAQARNNILPLVTAELNADFRERENRGDYVGARNPQLLKTNQMIFARLWKLQTVGRRFGGALIAPSSFLNLAALLATVEALRMRSGSREGLLSLMLGPVSSVGKRIAPDWFGPVADPVQEAGEKFAMRIEEIRQARMEQTQLPGGTENALAPGDLQVLVREATPPPSSVPAVDNLSPHFDATMQTEGLPWVTDLTLTDPTYAIPFALSAIMIVRILLRPTKKKPIKPGSLVSWPARYLQARYSMGQSLGMLLSSYFFYIATYMPAGLVLYFASSALVGTLQTRWLQARMPLRPAIQACKRPTRLKAKKLWADVK